MICNYSLSSIYMYMKTICLFLESERLQQLQDSLDECYKKKRQTKHREWMSFIFLSFTCLGSVYPSFPLSLFTVSKESERLKTDCISTRKKTTEGINDD